MSMFLNANEMQELTGRIQHRSQARELNYLGIVHRVRADGSMLVLRAHVEQVLGVKRERRPATNIEPNWAACNGNRRDDPK